MRCEPDMQRCIELCIEVLEVIFLANVVNFLSVIQVILDVVHVVMSRHLMQTELFNIAVPDGKNLWIAKVKNF